MSTDDVIVIRNIKKDYVVASTIIPALKGVDLSVKKGEIIAIMGTSGSGKSTFMNILGCLDKATSGDYYLDGISVMNLNEQETSYIRNKKIGFVFQSFNLLNRSSAIENVELPLIYNSEYVKTDFREKAVSALKRVGLEDRVNHQTQQLSGGQQQRVAIARALVNGPSLLLADEPTGNLDSKTSTDIMNLFVSLNEQGITIVLVTHDINIAKYAHKRYLMKDGLMISDK